MDRIRRRRVRRDGTGLKALTGGSIPFTMSNYVGDVEEIVSRIWAEQDKGLRISES